MFLHINLFWVHGRILLNYKARSFSNSYGSYFHEGHTITVVRQFTINKGTYPHSQFAEINELMKALTDGESRKIVVKEEECSLPDIENNANESNQQRCLKNES